MINAQRSRRGLRRLTPNGALFHAASGHARDMVRRRYVSHYSRGQGPTSRVAGAGYLRGASGYTVGENIAWQSARNLRWVISQWLRSPAHRRLLLLPSFKELGIGVTKSTPRGHHGGLTVVVDFGRRG